jgi:LAO/AO transport system ATPase
MRPPPAADDLAALWRRFRDRDRRALSRLLTLAAQGRPLPDLEQLEERSGTCRVVAVTGSAGVGKSSLLGALLEHIIEQGRSAAVLACDPESPLTGGALLGDRCRIAGSDARSSIFIRSLPARGGRQGLAEHLDQMLPLLRAYGFDWIFVETVGIGQTDSAVRSLADIVVLVVQPQTGDALQWEKAGVMEIADVIVVNKGDLPGADRTMVELHEELKGRVIPRVHEMSPLTPGPSVRGPIQLAGSSIAGRGEQRGERSGLGPAPKNRPGPVMVLKTSVARSEGISELYASLESFSIRPCTPEKEPA